MAQSPPPRSSPGYQGLSGEGGGEDSAPFSGMRSVPGKRLLSPMSPRRAAIVAVVAVAAIALLLPLDASVLRLTERFQPAGDLPLGGDLKREIEFIQQFGDFVCVAIVFAAIALLDPGGRRRLWDGLAAVLASALGFFFLKLAIGRPRPQLHDPLHFLGPLQSYPLTQGGHRVASYSWEFWRPVSDLWSMPSSHTAAATALAIVLARLYPRLTPLVAILAIIVGLCRVTLAAHYPTDVVAGWALGLIAAGLAMDKQWGQRIVRLAGLGPASRS